MTAEATLESLASDFWKWRAWQQPRSHDDIPRLERPKEWIPNWSKENVSSYLSDLENFERRLNEIEITNPEHREILVDYKLLKSAFARVRWEIEYLEMWRRFPRFYIDQTIGVVFDYLVNPNVTRETVEHIERNLNNFKTVLTHARQNLTGYAFHEHATVSIEDLGNIDSNMKEMGEALLEFISNEKQASFLSRVSEAAQELVDFREWLKLNLSSFVPASSIGEKSFVWFLQNVAYIPYTPSEMISIGEIEFDKATTFEAIFENKYKDKPIPQLPKSATEQSENESKLEQEVRDFYERENLLTQPESLGHYLNAPRPKYLEPIKWLGVTDDLTGPSRLDEDGISYVPVPRDGMPYFYAANARDPRAGIVHEGAHYQQLALSWRNPRFIRRHFYDSGVNEGIAFYNEELMLAAGLFNDAPHSQTLMYNFMKLRALRVIIDVSLATGRMSIDDAANYLSKKVPMDWQTAHEEAVFFASFPGQGLTYQIGKSQIINFMAEARRRNPSEFSLRKIHDYLWINGNVPISLLKWEYLKLPVDEIFPQDISHIKEIIWKNIRHMLDCYLAKDRKNADNHIAEDVTLWDSVEPQLIFGLRGLNALRDRRPSSESGPKVLSIENLNPVIDVIGEIAIARYELLIHFDSGIPDEHIRNTAVWRIVNGAWKVIHNHEDVIS